jgi:AraC-like DNA-binding protein
MSSATEPTVSVAPLAYRERAPSSELAHVVQSFWELRVAPELREPYLHRVFPDGCLGLVFQRCGAQSALMLRPPRLEPHAVQAPPGACYWGVRVAPPSAAAFFGRAPAELGSDLEQALPDATRSLLPALAAAISFEDALAAVSAYVTARAVAPRAIDPRIRAAVERIERERGQSKIAELARAVRMSERQFQRCFLAASGLTPKQYARTRRLRAIAVELAQAKHEHTAHTRYRELW